MLEIVSQFTAAAGSSPSRSGNLDNAFLNPSESLRQTVVCTSKDLPSGDAACTYQGSQENLAYATVAPGSRWGLKTE
jgi:hypothetical protein